MDSQARRPDVMSSLVSMVFCTAVITHCTSAGLPASKTLTAALSQPGAYLLPLVALLFPASYPTYRPYLAFIVRAGQAAGTRHSISVLRAALGPDADAIVRWCSLHDWLSPPLFWGLVLPCRVMALHAASVILSAAMWWEGDSLWTLRSPIFNQPSPDNLIKALVGVALPIALNTFYAWGTGDAADAGAKAGAAPDVYVPWFDRASSSPAGAGMTIKLEGIEPEDLKGRGLLPKMVEGVAKGLEARGHQSLKVGVSVLRGCCLLVLRAWVASEAAGGEGLEEIDLEAEEGTVMQHFPPDIRGRITSTTVASRAPTLKLLPEGPLPALPATQSGEYSFTLDAAALVEAVSDNGGAGAAPSMSDMCVPAAFVHGRRLRNVSADWGNIAQGPSGGPATVRIDLRLPLDSQASSTYGAFAIQLIFEAPPEASGRNGARVPSEHGRPLTSGLSVPVLPPAALQELEAFAAASLTRRTSAEGLVSDMVVLLDLAATGYLSDSGLAGMATARAESYAKRMRLRHVGLALAQLGAVFSLANQEGVSDTDADVLDTAALMDPLTLKFKNGAMESAYSAEASAALMHRAVPVGLGISMLFSAISHKLGHPLHYALPLFPLLPLAIAAFSLLTYVNRTNPRLVAVWFLTIFAGFQRAQYFRLESEHCAAAEPAGRPHAPPAAGPLRNWDRALKESAGCLVILLFLRAPWLVSALLALCMVADAGPLTNRIESCMHLEMGPGSLLVLAALVAVLPILLLRHLEGRHRVRFAATFLHKKRA